LSAIVPLDANHNPIDAKIDETRVHATLGYERPAGAGTWASLLSLTHTERDTVRGFLREELDVPSDTPNADGFRQDFSGDDLYFDTHWEWHREAKLSLVTGVDLLLGKGEAASENFEYHVDVDGSNAPSSEGAAIDEAPESEDERTFGGAYALALWSPTSRWRIDAGARLNVTEEKQEGEVEENGVDVQAEDSRSDTRGSGSLGASFRAWDGPSGALWIYASYTDAFKPAAVDFGPEAEGQILDPETARTAQLGVKGAQRGGRLAWEASVYRMDFDNLVIAATEDGLPTLANAGEERFDGLEAGARWRARDDLDVQASWALHSAEFRDYVREFDGMPTQLAGNSLELSADQLGSAGVTWHPARHFFAGAGLNYVGERFLDKRNNAPADPFTTWFADVGHRFDRGLELRVDGVNLSDERDPVSESELGEAQFYRMPARSWRATLIWHLGA
jgi:outer membrane receptor protein involved in Fe transport